MGWDGKVGGGGERGPKQVCYFFFVVSSFQISTLCFPTSLSESCAAVFLALVVPVRAFSILPKDCHTLSLSFV